MASRAYVFLRSMLFQCSFSVLTAIYITFLTVRNTCLSEIVIIPSFFPFPEGKWNCHLEKLQVSPPRGRDYFFVEVHAYVCPSVGVSAAWTGTKSDETLEVHKVWETVEKKKKRAHLTTCLLHNCKVNSTIEGICWRGWKKKKKKDVHGHAGKHLTHRGKCQI